MNLKVRVAIISVGVNVLLVILKLLLARWSHSASILADAIHSLSDIFVSMLVLSSLILTTVGAKRQAVLWRKIEDVVAVVVGVFILAVAVQIFTGAVKGTPKELVRLPFVLLGIFVCILFSGFIARLKIKVGREHNSTSLVADGYHSRMDMYSSIGVMIGLLGSMAGLNLDIQAAALISLLIAATGLEVIYGGVRALFRGTYLMEYWLAGLLEGSRPGRLMNAESGHWAIEMVLWIHKRGRAILVDLIILMLVIWLFTGLYVVGPGEQAFVFRFGRLVSETGFDPGLHVHIPWPIESIRKISIETIRRLEIGFRTQTDDSVGSGQSYQWESRHVRGKYTKKPEESILFTGDENLIDVNAIVQYRVVEATKFFLQVQEPEKLVRSAAEGAIRKVVGMEALDGLFTSDRVYVEEKIRKTLNDTMKRTDSGIWITAIKLQDVHPPVEVVDYFRDVASAREDKNRLINEAFGYRNEILPKARGQYSDRVCQAEAEKQERIDHARGEAEKFTLLLKQYQKARTINEVRMFLETMDATLPELEKFIVEPDASYEPVDLRFFTGQSEDILTVEEK